jgi:methionyl-tRNA formyltransferase
MDTGNILEQVDIPLFGTETTETLSSRMSELAGPLLEKVLSSLKANNQQEYPQNHREATYCPLIQKKDGVIDWGKTAEEIDALVRAFTPWPRAQTVYSGKSLLVLEASVADAYSIGEAGKIFDIDKSKGILIQTGHGTLAVTRLQLQAKKAMDWRSFLNGNRSFIGSVLGE